MNFTKVTDSASIGGNCCPQYPTKDAFNCDDSKFLVLGPQCFYLWDGITLQMIEILPWCGDTLSEPIWSRTDPDLFYFHSENKLMTYRVSTKVKSLIATFTDYSVINFGGKGDLSDDSNHVACVGTRLDGRKEVFLYTISSGFKSPALDVTAGYRNVFVTPDNNVLVTLRVVNGTTKGMELFNGNMAYLRDITSVEGHCDFGRDADGSEIIVWCNSAENPITLPDFPNGIIKVRLADGHQVGLLSLDWSLAVHISCPRKGVPIVETYDPNNPSSTKPYANSILSVPLDGSAVQVLLKHGSNSSTYDGQPRASIARDASRFIFGSNMGGPLTDVYYCGISVGSSSGSGTGTSGILASVNGTSTPASTNPTVPMFHYPDQQGLTAANFPAKPGEGGFVWDGKNMRVIFWDGSHKFAGTLIRLN